MSRTIRLGSFVPQCRQKEHVHTPGARQTPTQLKEKDKFLRTFFDSQIPGASFRGRNLGHLHNHSSLDFMKDINY